MITQQLREKFAEITREDRRIARTHSTDYRELRRLQLEAFKIRLEESAGLNAQ